MNHYFWFALLVKVITYGIINVTFFLNEILIKSKTFSHEHNIISCNSVRRRVNHAGLLPCQPKPLACQIRSGLEHQRSLKKRQLYRTNVTRIKCIYNWSSFEYSQYDSKWGFGQTFQWWVSILTKIGRRNTKPIPHANLSCP